MIVDLGDAPEVVATIVTLGPSERLTTCIESLLGASGDARLAILCIVNSLGPVPDDQRRSGASYRSAGINLGWAGGLAFARRLHEAPLIWLIQDDMTVAGDCLANLRADLADGYVAASPTGLRGDGLVDPTGFGHHAANVLATPWFPPTEPFPLSELDVPDTMPYLPSRGMLVETWAWDSTGGYDPRFYPVLWADVDFCMALSRAGLRFRHSRTATIHHAGQGSTPTALGQFLSQRNSELFRAKWFDRSGDVGEQRIPTSEQIRARMRESVASMTLDPGVPEWLIASTAISASDAFLQLARTYSSEASEWGRLLSQHSQALAELHLRAQGLADSEAEHRRSSQDARAEVDSLIAQVGAAVTRSEVAEAMLKEVTSSRSWRLTSVGRTVVRVARSLLAQSTTSNR